MDDNMEESFVLIEFEQEIVLVRVINNTFVPSKIKLSAEVIPVHDLQEEEFDASITKMRFWLEAVVSRCIAFSRDNTNAIKMLIDAEGRNNSDNMLLLTPLEPTDQHLAALFQAKLTALCGGDIIIGSVEMRSNNMAGLVFRFIGEAEDILPTMGEWIGTHTFFDEPWWMRDDASTLDVTPALDADLTKKPDWAYSLDFLSKTCNTAKDVIVRPEFQPTVIEGGKKDDDE